MTSPPCTSQCPDWHLTELVDPGDLVRQADMRAAWARLKDSVRDLAMIQLAASWAPEAVSHLILDHPDFRDHVRRDLAPDVRNLKHVRNLQEWHRQYDGPDHQDHQEALDRLGPDAVRRADATEALLRLIIKPGIELSRAEPGEAEFLRLTQAAVDADRRSRMWEAAIPTLGHAPTRDRLKLAGSVSNRRALGYGRDHRGQHVPEDSAEAEPQRTDAVTERDRPDQGAQGRRVDLRDGPDAKPRRRSPALAAAARRRSRRTCAMRRTTSWLLS